METNVPIRSLFADRLIPLMRAGHHIQLTRKDGSIMDMSMNWRTQEFHVGSDMMNAEDALYEMASTLNHGAMPNSWLCVDNIEYIPVYQIEAYFPQLTCSGKLFKSWRK